MCAIEGRVTAFGTHGGSITSGIREGNYRCDGGHGCVLLRAESGGAGAGIEPGSDH